MKLWKIKIYYTKYQKPARADYSTVLADTRSDAKRIAEIDLRKRGLVFDHVTATRELLYPGKCNQSHVYEANGGLWATSDGLTWRHHNLGTWAEAARALNA